VIKLLRKLEPLRGLQSARDGRRLVDMHPAVYLCPPDALHESQHEWTIMFEAPRWRKFEIPSSFASKDEAARYIGRIR